VAIVGAALAVAGCGGSAHDRTPGASTTTAAGHSYTVSVPIASFATKQSLAGSERFVIAVRNLGGRALPNVAVTICNTTCSYKARRGQGTTVQAFSYAIANAPNLANASRPIWIVQRAPGPCGYSCRNLGPGAAVTAYSNTWALGRLAPGHTARFVWTVTPVKTGHFVVAWEVAAALSGDNRAVLTSGAPARGKLTVHVSPRPPQYVVQPNGKVTTKRRSGAAR
jgi:hypothetical protein